MKTENIYCVKLVLGDPCADGHGQKEEVRMKSNYDAFILWEAYQKSCELTGVYFDNEYGRHPRAIWSDYEDFDIEDDALETLQSYGININRSENEETLCLDGEEMWDDQYLFATKLIMQFIGLSMPKDWQYTIEENDPYETINDNQIGYGLFY